MAGGAGPVVVGVDGSPGSLSALRWALTEAETSGRELVAVTVWRGRFPAGAKRELLALLRRSGGDRPGVRALVEAGDPASVLVAAARGASMLVLGSHGHGRMLRSLVGSTGTGCLHRARCPVVVVPAYRERRLFLEPAG